MKIYWSVILAVWTTNLTTYAFIRAGETSGPTTDKLSLTFLVLFMTLFPALLGFLIGKEKS